MMGERCNSFAIAKKLTMPIPGQNLYQQATQLIAKQAYTYYATTGRATDERGLQQTTYATGVDRFDSIQAVKRELYAELGLDWQKFYVHIFTSDTLAVVERDGSGDQIEYNGERYQCLSSTDWGFQDGWHEVLAVRLITEVAP